jgi:hypothetical protein
VTTFSLQFPLSILGYSSTILPFRRFVLKVHSRSDLACDHCYVTGKPIRACEWWASWITPETYLKQDRPDLLRRTGVVLAETHPCR